MAWRDLFPWGRKSAHAYALTRDLLSLPRSRSGRVVDEKTALEVSTVFGCARVIGHGIAQVPRKVRQRTGMSRIEAVDHPLTEVLRKPNPWQTGFEFFETLAWHTELCGRFVAFKNVGARGLLELIPFEPSAVTVKRADSGVLTYVVRSASGSMMEFPEQAIWHFRGPSWNGWDGIPVLRTAREAIGLAMAAEESQSSLHRLGVQSSGAWSVEGKLQADQYVALRDWIEREHVGPGNAGRPMILDRAAKWVSTAMTGVDAQHLETRRHQVEEICRHFGVMPIMVGYSDKAATYASAESMFLAHVMHCLSPRWTRLEESIDAYLLTEKDRAQGLYMDFVEEGMIRGSVKDTKDALLGYVNGGLMTPNEGRAKLDLNPDADPASDKLRIPVNTVNDPEQPADAGAPKE